MDNDGEMSTPIISYKNHRFPPSIIAHAVWLYFRVPLSLRLVEEMLLERGIAGSYETRASSPSVSSATASALSLADSVRILDSALK